MTGPAGEQLVSKAMAGRCQKHDLASNGRGCLRITFDGQPVFLAGKQLVGCLMNWVSCMKNLGHKSELPSCDRDFRWWAETAAGRTFQQTCDAGFNHTDEGDCGICPCYCLPLPPHVSASAWPHTALATLPNQLSKVMPRTQHRHACMLANTCA